MLENESSHRFSRRDLIKATGVALGAFAFEKKGFQASAHEQVPSAVSEIFTTSPEEVNSMKYDQITFMTTFESDSGISAILNVTPDGSRGIPARFQLAEYDVIERKFGEFQDIGTGPMPDCTTAALLPGSDDQTLTILAGINEGQTQEDANGDRTTPRLFFSGDEGKSYDEIELIDQSGERLSRGKVLDVKRIPQSRIALVQVVLPTMETGYGIFDPETKIYTPVSSDMSLPVLDDIYMSKDGQTLQGVGRVIERVKGGFSNLKGISNIELDLKTNSVTQTEIYHNNDNISMRSCNIQRDDEGKPSVGYGVQKYNGDREQDRHYYRINMQSGEIETIDYGPFMDQVVLRAVKPENFMPKELFVGSFPRVNDITPVKGGLLVTGFIQIPQAGAHPMAVFIPKDVDPTTEMDKVQVFPFNDLIVFPGDIDKVLAGVFPQNPFARNQAGTSSHHGFLLDMGACGQALISTDENYVPSGEAVVYAVKSPQSVF